MPLLEERGTACGGVVAIFHHHSVAFATAPLDGSQLNTNMKYEHLPYNKNLKSNARDLRKSMTKQERHLWYDFFFSYPVRIYRQKIVLDYILDFYCHSAKLGIELDGSQHYEDDTNLKDNQRTLILNNQGIKIIRFSNLDIDKNFNGVCEYIHNTIQNRLKEKLQWENI